MEKKSLNVVLKEVLKNIKPTEEQLKKIEIVVNDFKDKVKAKIKKLKIDAEIFVGGSFAKGTMIKKDIYDVDIFIRFDKKYKNISSLTEKILSDFEKTETKGSRNYFIIDKGHFFIEVVPVIKTKNPDKAENVTDLSYSHVYYIKKKIRNEKIRDEIKLAKAFCYANNCYGAESYISGFSGYAIELLICHYGSFLNFIKAFEKIKEKKVIDIEKHFKNQNEVLMDLNESKLKSPVILIDPTHKNRNALAALSYKTFERFKTTCREFLRKPSESFFEIKKIDFNDAEYKAKKKKLDFAIITAETEKQSGDIAGSKLLKLYNFLNSELGKYFFIKEKEFEYNGGKTAKFFFSGKGKGEIVAVGPQIKDNANVKLFKRKHKHTFSKSGRVYAREKIKLDLNNFLRSWKSKNGRKIDEMYVKKITIN